MNLFALLFLTAIPAFSGTLAKSAEPDYEIYCRSINSEWRVDIKLWRAGQPQAGLNGLSGTMMDISIRQSETVPVTVYNDPLQWGYFFIAEESISSGNRTSLRVNMRLFDSEAPVDASPSDATFMISNQTISVSCNLI